MKKEYGYRRFDDQAQLNSGVLELYEKQILPNIPEGLSGCIYTQLSDVEDECNGLWTQDREVLKIDPDRMRRINERMKRRGSK